MRMVAVTLWLPLDEQVAPVMPPLPLLLLDEELELLELEELELLLEDDEPVFEYEQ